MTASATDSRYVGKPMLVLFESFILDVIGHLDASRASGMIAMAPRLRQTFNASSADWQGIVKETLHLSPTIEVAILDLWIRNTEIAERDDQILDPIHYSQMFADEYLRDGSEVDVWPDGALELAKARIAAWKRRSG